MKMNITVELDFIGEDCTLDEEIKMQLLKNIENKIVSKVEKELIENVSKGVLDRKSEIEKVIDLKITETYDNFLSKEFEVTDRWGDTHGKTSVKEILKEKFEKFMTEKVDEYGKSSSYGKHRYEHIINNEAKKQIETFVNAVSTTVLNGIKKDINKEAQDRITQAILSDYDLKKIIK